MQESSNDKVDTIVMNGVQSIERALDLLECLARGAGWMGISELSVATGLPVATIHRLLKTLMTRNYVVRDSRTRRYALGPAFHMMVNSTTQIPDWNELATWHNAPFWPKNAVKFIQKSIYKFSSLF